MNPTLSKRDYNKPPLSFRDQLELLKSRNLHIEDESTVLRYLEYISYYRLSAYFLPYQTTKDCFNEGTTFDNIITTYSFDRELRLLVFDCIERIEIAIRTQIVNILSIKHNNSHWQDDPQVFIDPVVNACGQLYDPYEDVQKLIEKAKSSLFGF
jgi:abortive infection bacteriophage resistance protein